MASEDMETESKLVEPRAEAKTPKNKNNGRKHKRTCKEFLKKYLFEGQALQASHMKKLEAMSDKSSWYQCIMLKNRRLVGMIIPASFFHFFWWAYFIKYNTWGLFSERYKMSLVMVFGSLIAGMTSEGGGSVAFPVMTLAFSISPAVARDFSLLIQACGMTAASFTIYWMRVYIEWRVILLCTLGGVFGSILSYEVIDQVMPPAHKKMGFVSLFFTFAFALFLLNRIHKRTTFKCVPDLKWWKVVVLIITGFFGGIFTGIAGNGIDICTFSILTLYFRVSEKTATPTSVVLMAINSIFGSYWRLVMRNEIEAETWEYLAVCVPIVVIGAPLGSLIGTHFHRQTLACLNYITDTVALVSGFAIVKMTDTTIGLSIGIIAFGFGFYGLITWFGGRMMENVEAKNRRQNVTERI